jgi:hypothetical protein
VNIAVPVVAVRRSGGIWTVKILAVGSVGVGRAGWGAGASSSGCGAGSAVLADAAVDAGAVSSVVRVVAGTRPCCWVAVAMAVAR